MEPRPGRNHHNLSLMTPLRILWASVFLTVPAAAQGSAVTPWKPVGISSGKFESHAAFDPRTRDLYFVRSAPDFSGWRILMSHCTRAGWSTPKSPAFAGDGVEADPYFADGGRRLYFISTRSDDGVKQKDLDLWLVERDSAEDWPPVCP